LSHNELTGSIPDLHELTSLEYVDLGTNKLTGPIPEWIDAWSDLKVMGFENNLLTGQLPPELVSLTDLMTLDLKKNLFRGEIDVVNGLSNLNYLYLSQNGFADYVGSDFLMHLNYIQELDVSNNLLYGDSLPQSLLTKPYLKLLDVSANALRGPFPEINETNSVLEVLEMNANGFTGTIPSSIEKLVNLKHLDMQMVSVLQAKAPDSAGKLS
jgi:Leucine-rich repeat (LRR) protein